MSSYPGGAIERHQQGATEASREVSRRKRLKWLGFGVAAVSAAYLADLAFFGGLPVLASVAVKTQAEVAGAITATGVLAGWIGKTLQGDASSLQTTHETLRDQAIAYRDKNQQ